MGNSASLTLKTLTDVKLNENLNLNSTKSKFDFSVLNMDSLLNDLKLNLKKYETSLKYLECIKDPFSVKRDEQLLNAISFMRKLGQQEDFQLSDEKFKLINNYKVEHIFISLLDFYRAELLRLTKTHKIVETNSDEQDYFKLTFNLVENIFIIVWTNNKSSHLFRAKFHEKGGTEVLLKYLSDEMLVRNLIEVGAKEEREAVSDGVRLLRTIIGALRSLSKLADIDKQDWQRLKSTEKIIKFAEWTKEYPGIRLEAYMTVANVMDDNEITTLPDALLVVSDLVSLINMGAKALRDKTELKRIKICVDDRGEVEVVLIEYLNSQYDIIELIESLNKIAVCDNMKYELYEKRNLKDAIRVIIMEGNSYEKEFATKLLWQLCFDKKILEEFRKDHEMHTFLKANRHTKNASLNQNIEGILFTSRLQNGRVFCKKMAEKKLKKMREKNNIKIGSTIKEPVGYTDLSEKKEGQVDDESDELEERIEEVSSIPSNYGEETTTDNVNKHIMISYNIDSRDICLRIKAELETLGYKVWIDVENIRGSSLQSMAAAVENSFCVLICMTEKYKQSPNCRAEAEYSFNLRKPIVPLILQANYRPDGWLGIILGSKIYVNFTKLPFEECFEKLKCEVNNVLIENNISSEIVTEKKISKPPAVVKETPAPKVEKTARNWTQYDAEQWLNEKKFHSSITKSMKKFDGELLDRLWLISKEAPDFYYSTISKNGSVEIFDVVRFTNELTKLFNSNSR